MERIGEHYALPFIYNERTHKWIEGHAATIKNWYGLLGAERPSGIPGDRWKQKVLQIRIKSYAEFWGADSAVQVNWGTNQNYTYVQISGVGQRLAEYFYGDLKQALYKSVGRDYREALAEDARRTEEMNRVQP